LVAGFKQVMKMRGSIKSVGGVLVTAVLLSGCGWFDGPPKLEKLRPGVEKAISPSDSLPAPSSGRSYDAAIVPVDASAPAIGSIVAASGGQKAQLEKLEKDAAARDAEDRAQRERTAANKANSEPPVLAKTISDKTVGTGDKPGEPPTQPAAPPRAPVTAVPVSPPTDGDPLGPNNTPTKPAGT
jgi:hypothetical protein